MPFPRALRLFLRSRFIRIPIVAPLVCTLALATAVGSATAATSWTNGQAATLVLGADNFTTAGGGASASRFGGPTDICADAATGKVFVVAHNQNRLLRFSATAATKNGGVAEAVFGQPNFTSSKYNNGGLSAKSLSRPMTCAMDAAGRLFVTDNLNKRVLRYDNAATKSSFAEADGVLGQADFVSMNTGTTADLFGTDSLLYGIALDAHGNLYVSDGANKRVLRFNNAATKANGASADGVLGADDLATAGAGGVTASTFGDQIYGLTVDAAGNLYVSDAANRRILRFDNAAAKANGAPADGVLGVPDFITPGGSVPASALTVSNTVYGIDVLADGALYVADYLFSRVLVYNDPASKANGAAADYVLGQTEFASSAQATTASGLKSPLGLGYNAQAGYLMIPDYSNNRVVGHFAESLKPNAAPTASSVTITGAATVGQELIGSYTYADADGDNEGASTFVWKRGSTVISGATALKYVLVADDVDQKLTFCVTPVASAGTATGTQACSAPTATVTQGPVNGACGNAHNSGNTPLLTSAPSGGLCSAGTPSSVTSASTTFTWSCAGTGGGTTGSCQAPRGYSVSPSAGANGSISPDTEQVVAYQATPSFTLSPNSGYVVDGVNGTCGGSIAGNTYTTATVAQNCAFIANFQPAPTYAITASVHANVGGVASCNPATVTHGGNATCTATPATHYRFSTWTGACAGQGATCTLTNIQAAQASTAVFAYEITVPEGPQQGQPVGVTPPAQNNWTINSASTAPTNSIATPPPSTVELPQGIVALKLATGTPGTSATVVLTYPKPLPAGTKYYKFGKTPANPTPHWYEFSGAVISGNTITLTLTDGGAGDNDLTADGFIDDPGGPGLSKAAPTGAQAIPTLSEWGVLLLSALAAAFGLRAARRRG